MSKPFDTTLNVLTEARPADWVAFLAPRAGLTPGPAELVDTDVSVAAQADRAFRLTADGSVLHVEFESNPRLGIPHALLRYHVLLAHPAGTDVRSVLVLLRPKAEASDLTGAYARPGVEFRYAVVRVWQESVETFLARGPTLAPLALLTDEAAADLPAAAARFAARLRRPDIDGNLVKELGMAAKLLGGLRYDKTQVEAILMSLQSALEDSWTYQEVIRRGKEQGLVEGRAAGRAEGQTQTTRDNILLLGGDRFGAAPPAAVAAVQAVADPDRLKRMLVCVLHAAGWDDVLATP